MMKQISLLCIAFLLALSFCCCGKKAAPLPPNSKEPKEISDLAAEADGIRVKLRWTAPEGEARFVVFKAEECKESCPGCPLEFKRLGEVDIAEYFDTPSQECSSHYKVIVISKDNMESKDSNIISIH
ncbi:MAG: hypothetical protein V1753_00120 [Pseudomonadota bacterium]